MQIKAIVTSQNLTHNYDRPYDALIGGPQVSCQLSNIGMSGGDGTLKLSIM